MIHDESKNVQLTFLEQLVEEQKMKKGVINKNLIRRISGGIDVELLEGINGR